MGRLFWLIATVAVLLAIVASIPGLVIGLTFLSGFLLAPLWPVAANLWWVVLLAAPVVWFYWRGEAAYGVALSVALLVGGGAAFTGCALQRWRGSRHPS
jgi:hypothetical protein